jgi:regulator of protease activity HflC (stomatin/prohibitin superfamily)
MGTSSSWRRRPRGSPPAEAGDAQGKGAVVPDEAIVPVVVASILVFFVIVFAMKGLKVISQSTTMVIERLGKFHKTLGPGINIIWPIIDRPRLMWWRWEEVIEGGRAPIVRKKQIVKIDLRETVYDFPRQGVITSDNVSIQINALLYFQITDARKAVYEIENLPDAIEKLTQTTLRNVIGELDLDATLTSRDTINDKLRNILDEATDKWGVKVTRVELQDINPPTDVKEAMEKQMRAERDRRAKILEAEGQKKSQVLEAEGAREALVNRAEGEKKSMILVAEGKAEARKMVADAEAEAIRKITEAVKGGRGDPTTYLLGVRYIETLKEMVSGKDNKVIYMPYEATGVLGSIGSIKEMLGGTLQRE